jgi:hypothetical protein
MGKEDAVRKRSIGSRSSSRRRKRSRRVQPVALMIGGTVGLIVLLLAISLWQSGAFADPPSASGDGDAANVLPLTQAGRPLQGGHDMALIPKQTPAPRTVAEGVAAPRLNLPGLAHDFGRIYADWDVTHVFAIENRGSADLSIDNLVTSCGCTTAELSSDVIPPGQRADLKVTFDADLHETRGQVTRLVWFATNDPAQPWVEVRVDAYVQ